MTTSSNNSKRIGYVDFRLDNFHANTYLAALRGALAHRGYQITAATATDTELGREWAKRNNVAYYESVNEMAAEVDFFMVLAPSDPQTHLEMCEQVFPYSKPTFVDKTFAPDVATAKRIFQLADEYQTAVQTTSALRSTEVQRYATSCRDEIQCVYAWAGGSNFAEYIIHPVELIVSCLGADASELMRSGLDSHPQLLLRYTDGRMGVIDFADGVDVDFAAAVTTRTATRFIPIDGSRLFADAASFVLDFFDAGKPLVDRRETFLIQRILELAESEEVRGRFVRLSGIQPPHWRSAAVGRALVMGKSEGQL